jgi:hypothetical protein
MTDLRVFNLAQKILLSEASASLRRIRKHHIIPQFAFSIGCETLLSFSFLKQAGSMAKA